MLVGVAAVLPPLTAALLGAACGRDPGPERLESRPPPARSEGPSRVEIPGGAFASGTEPGRFERDPALEPRLARSALGPFAIDSAPYPGGSSPPLLGLGREQAVQRCSERGGRLCSELEWERACKGPEQHPFPSGTELDPACQRSPGCASGFGVWGLASAREWTASDLPHRGELMAVLRGAAKGASTAQHRCAHRELASGDPAPDIAFRCCYGAPNAARVVSPRPGAAFAAAAVSLPELSQLLADHSATRGVSRDLSYFDGATAQATVLAKARRDHQGTRFTSAPLLWNPSPGVELLVVTARSGATTSFVAAFDVLGDGSRRLASSFTMLGEPGPVALAYSPGKRARLEFTTCWGCPGETGRVTYRDPDRTVITQP